MTSSPQLNKPHDRRRSIDSENHRVRLRSAEMPARLAPDFSVFRRRFGGRVGSLRERRRRPKRVLVVQSAQHGFRSHERTRRPSTSRFSLRGACRSCGTAGYAGTQCAVRTPAVVMNDPLAQDRTQVPLRHRNHPVQALAPDRSDHPLADRVRLGARER